MSASTSASPSPGPNSSTVPTPVNRHAPTAVEMQRQQLARLLKDPEKPAYIPASPKEKTIRPPREMMKNVQGSSAGAGSGEFHVYKASRRREYERLKIMDEKTQKEAAERDFEEKKRQWEEEAEAKTAKNRAKRQKKKEKAKTKGGASNVAGGENTIVGAPAVYASDDAPLKKRRLVNGAEMVFKKPGNEDEGSEDEDEPGPAPQDTADQTSSEIVEDAANNDQPQVAIVNPKITIHEDD